MIKYGAHAFVWIGDWNTQSGNDTIKAAAKAGVDFLEIPMLDPQTFDSTSHKRVLEAENLLATASLVLPNHAHMPDHPKAALEFLTLALERLDALGSRYLCGCLAYALGVLKGRGPTPFEHQTVVDVMGEVAARAHKLGITLALESVNRYETYLYNALADTRATVLKIGAPNLKLHADTYHMNIEENGFYQPIVDNADLLEYIHMSESHRGMVGTGTIDWDQMFAGLRDANFSGYLALESFAAVNPALAAATCMWRAPIHTGAELAAGGMKFLREKASQYGLGSR